MTEKLGKYARLAILTSLVEPKSLSELGLFWYNENGRFYKKKARQEIERAVNEKMLLKNKNKYQADTNKLISRVCSRVNDKNLREHLLKFWSHPFSQHTYLCCESIKHMFNNNPEKAVETEPSLILNMPLILHMLQEKDPEVYSLFVSSHNLKKYANTINIQAEKNLSKAFKNLKEKTDWLSTLNKIIKNNGYFLEQTSGELRIKQMIRERRK